MHLVEKNCFNDSSYIYACILNCGIYDRLIFLSILRLLQGLTAGGSIVIAKASIGDKFSGDEMAKFLTSLMVVNGIITIIAPLLGGFALTIST